MRAPDRAAADRFAEGAGRGASSDAEARVLLDPYRKRVLRAFLRRYRGCEVEAALYDLLYGDRRELDHALVRAIDRRLECDPNHTVGDVLNGWRPPELES